MFTCDDVTLNKIYDYSIAKAIPKPVNPKK